MEYIYKDDYEVINGSGIAKGLLIGGCLETLNNLHGDLQEYLVWYKDNNIYKSIYVLFGTFFKAFSDGTIDRWFNNALKKLDDTLPEGETFPRIVIHELRHSHASMLVNHGASLMIIAQRLGHSSIEEVSSRYGHLYPSTQKEIIKYL